MIGEAPSYKAFEIDAPRHLAGNAPRPSCKGIAMKRILLAALFCIWSGAVFAAGQSDVIAVDVLLQPDATMLRHAATDNARLLGVYPKGFALDQTHTPHITMLQFFVRRADLPRLNAAIEQVLAAAKVNSMRLEAYKRYYIPTGGGLGVAGIVARLTSDLRKLQTDITAAASPFNLRAGDINAFTAAHDNPAIDAAMVDYVAKFENVAGGENFNPHVSTGNAPTDYLDRMVAEPFTPLDFSPAGAAIYQLGPFGTAAKKLVQWDLK